MTRDQAIADCFAALDQIRGYNPTPNSGDTYTDLWRLINRVNAGVDPQASAEAIEICNRMAAAVGTLKDRLWTLRATEAAA
jgi:hypothetical protein